MALKSKGSTLARKLLAAIVVLSLCLTAAASLGAFFLFRDRSEAQRIEDFSLYVRERAHTEQGLFETLKGQHAGATRALMDHLKALDGVAVDRAFDKLFPLRADGTRRSAPQLFDGVGDGRGGYVGGVGAFLANGRSFSEDDKRFFLAVASVVSASGEAGRSRLDNFYFTGPDNRMVMYGPDRPDRLTRYRDTAPATLDFSHEEMTLITQPANDPAGEMRCTGLRWMIADPKAPLSIACLTPIYLHGRYVGAWGSTMPIGSYLTRAMRDAPAGATNLILSDKGALIAYPGFTRPGAVTPEAAARYARDLHLTDVVKHIQAQHRAFGVLDEPGSPKLFAYGRIAGPGWWFVMATPKLEIELGAAFSALVILLTGVLAVLAEAALLYIIVRRMVVSPLERLVRHTSAPDQTPRDMDPEIADLVRRDDEIGALARALETERRLSNDLLSSLETRVRERTAELERANEAKSRFLANMSHELRTPLNGVIALSETLTHRQRDAESREMASLIVSSGRLLEQVLTDILDFSKIDAGQLRLEEVEFDLETLVFRIAELHRASAEEKGLAFGWRVAPESLGRYSGDPVRITQILSNLLSNAVKFTEAGRVTLEIEAGSDGGLSFVVTDSGIGFDEDVRGRLFNRFEQADTSTTRRFGGSGLGLAICASLTRLMGGRILTESEPGRGSRFQVDLPLMRCATATTARLHTAERDDQDTGLNDLKVLLAEDHPTNQRIVELVLAQTGVALTIAGDGAQALEALARERFDVILMDMQMPVMDGVTAVRELRRREIELGHPRTPVIMLTANALSEHVEAARAAGADRHMTKPLRPDALIRAVSECAAGLLEDPETAAA